MCRASDSEASDEAGVDVSTLRAPDVAAAPPVDTSDLVLIDNATKSKAEASRAPGVHARVLTFNPTVDELYGGARADAGAVRAALRNHAAGHVEDASLPSAVFDAQYNSFHATGAALAPSGRAFGAAPAEPSAPAPKRKRGAESGAAARAVRASPQQPPQLSDGAWRLRTVQPWADKDVKAAELTEEQTAYLAQVAAEKAAKAAEEEAQSRGGSGATTQWHGGPADVSAGGRSWLAAPKGPKTAPEQCFLPKRWIHTWGGEGTGHSKGVNAIRFFPKSGHLLLSAGLDSKVKIWDVHGAGKCKRTYMGHTAGVREVNFNHDGTRFVSTAYDKTVQLWDTETGQAIQTLKNAAMFYCATLHPDPAKQNVLLAGASDKKIYQFDLDTGEMVQEYHYHLGPVNTITFLDEGRMFVSTSDDKSIRVWELGIPVQVKYIADPSMHSMPAVAVHPSGKFLSFQSLDNQIVTYTSNGARFKPNRKKVFKGHIVAGNACQVAFSPDGRYIMSGDAQGKLFFWDWQRPHGYLKTLPAHDKVVTIGCQWHPLETSKVATCGWDGLIKYWD